MAQEKISQKHIQKLSESNVYSGLSYDQMLEMHIDIPEEKERMRKQENRQKPGNIDDEDTVAKQSKTNERSSLLKLESLEQIKRRDMQ